MKKVQIDSSVEPIVEVATAALQIDGYYVKEFSCSVRDDLDEESHLAIGTGLHIQPSQVMEATPSVNLEILVGEHLKDRSKFRVLLDVESDDEEDAPYNFGLRLIGYFSFTGKLIKGTGPILHRNAAMLLYSAAREIVASVTGRGPFPAIMLPTLTFSLNDSVWKDIEDKLVADMKRVESRKRPRQLTSATKKASKKKATKKTSKK